MHTVNCRHSMTRPPISPGKLPILCRDAACRVRNGASQERGKPRFYIAVRPYITFRIRFNAGARRLAVNRLAVEIKTDRAVLVGR